MNRQSAKRASNWLLVAGVIFAAGCHREQRSGPAGATPVSVTVRTAELRRRLATEDVVGTVRARQRAVIEAKVSGRIEKLLAVPGQSVSAGERLVELDSGDIQARLEQSRAVRDQAEADLKRLTTLWQQGILSAAEYDSAQARAKVAGASTKEAETTLAFTRIDAPFGGVVTRKLAEIGDMATPGKALLEIENAQNLRLEADVPEAAIGRVKLGDSLAVSVSAVGSNLVGIVAEIAPAADSASRTFLVKLDLPAMEGLRAGQFGRVAWPVGEVSALVVADSAVVRRGQMEMVFVVDDQKAKLRLVKTGKRTGSDVEIVSGLGPGETVVADGAAGLRDGQPVIAR